jgi:site-specific recombinase XerD
MRCRNVDPMNRKFSVVATIALAAGTDLKTVSTSLGHSTIAITANVYAHVTESLHRENAA